MRLFGVVSGEDCLSGEAASSAARHRKAHLFDGGACSRFFLVSSFCPHRKKKTTEYQLNIQLSQIEYLYFHFRILYSLQSGKLVKAEDNTKKIRCHTPVAPLVINMLMDSKLSIYHHANQHYHTNLKPNNLK
jgi:hypothetical protein